MKRASDSAVLKSIIDSNLIFVSAQPDEIYFHWQVEIYLYQFSKHNIIDRCYALFGYNGDMPSVYAQKLANKYPCIKFYKDTREEKKYIPSIRPNLLSQFFGEFPHLGKNVFYHDSDIFLTKLPRFDLMLNPDDMCGYLSDTISYIGYNYIRECSGRYKRIHNSLADLDILNGMCKVLDIDPVIIRNNQNNSGGAQYLLKNIDASYWRTCEEKCEMLYGYLVEYEKKYPIGHHIQKWTTDMWVILWEYWRRGGKTVIHKELDFSWGTYTAKDYSLYNIFHLAGVTNQNCKDKFHKGKFTKETVFDAYLKNPKLFNNISPNNATYLYTNVIKEYINTVYLNERKMTSITLADKSKNITYDDINSDKPTDPAAITISSPEAITISSPEAITISSPEAITISSPEAITQSSSEKKTFNFMCNKDYAGYYTIDENKECGGKKVWRSSNGKYIMFWSGTRWILTYSVYEKSIGAKCGGIISTTSDVPYTSNWNLSNIYINNIKV